MRQREAQITDSLVQSLTQASNSNRHFLFFHSQGGDKCLNSPHMLTHLPNVTTRLSCQYMHCLKDNGHNINPLDIMSDYIFCTWRHSQSLALKKSAFSDSIFCRGRPCHRGGATFLVQHSLVYSRYLRLVLGNHPQVVEDRGQGDTLRRGQVCCHCGSELWSMFVIIVI